MHRRSWPTPGRRLLFASLVVAGCGSSSDNHDHSDNSDGSADESRIRQAG